MSNVNPDPNAPLDTFQEWDSISVAEFDSMTEAEREAYLYNLQLSNDLSAEQMDEITTQLESELETYWAYANALYNDLADLLTNGGLDEGQIASYEQVLKDLEDMRDMLDPDNDHGLLKDWEEATSKNENTHVELTQGDSYTHNIDDPANGDTYYVSVGEGEGNSGLSDFNPEDLTGLADLDGDGYYETELDADGDGIADEDWDKDGDIDDDDMHPGSAGGTTYEVDLPSGTETYFMDYDSSTNECTIKCTTNDDPPIVFYLKIKLDGIDKLIMPAFANLESVPDKILNMTYENSITDLSFGDHVKGVTDADAKESYDLEELENEKELEFNDQDYINNLEVTMNLESGVADTLTFNFDDDVNLSFKVVDGVIILVAEKPGKGTIEIKLEGLGTSVDESIADKIIINGGEFSDAALEDVADIAIPYDPPNGYGALGGLFFMVEFDDQELSEQYDGILMLQSVAL